MIDPTTARVAYRSLQGGPGESRRNHTWKVSLPPQMVYEMHWNPNDPIEIVLSEDGKSITMRQVVPAEYDLIYDKGWKRRRP